MSTHIAGHVPLAEHEKVAHAWKLWVAGAAIGALSLVGFYLAVTRWQEGWDALILLGSFLGPAVIYALGYFWYVPEVLGGNFRESDRTLCRRWSDFVLLAAFFGMVILGVIYALAVRENYSYIVLTIALTIIVSFAWLVPACAVAAKTYLGWTMPEGDPPNVTSWRDRVREAVSRLGGWLVMVAGTRRVMGVGAGLTLLSLILLVRAEIIFGPDYKGYQIVTGTGTWMHTDWWWSTTQPLPMLVLEQFYRIVYVAGLVVAALAIVGTLGGRIPAMIRRSRRLCLLAGIIALFQVTEVAVLGLHDNPSYLEFACFFLLWLVPIAIWLGFARGSAKRRDRTRIALMVYYVPIFLIAFCFLPFFTYLANGFGAFVAGMLLLWWGFVQSSGKAPMPRLRDAGTGTTFR